jgi:effector-binding domain-containing protein
MSIARKANREQWPVPSLASQERGTTWHGTYPTKLARNRSVLGELELFISRDGKSQSTGNIVTDWYPQIIDKDLFFRANSAIDSKRALPPRRDSSHRNIFQGVIFCGHCGATLARKAKAGGKNSKWYAQYVCSDRHRGASECPNVNAKELEDGLVPLIFRYFSEHLGDDSRLSKLRDELASVKGQISSIEVLRLRYLEAIELATLAVHLIVSKLDECERNLSNLQTSLSEIESQIKASASIPLNDADAIVVLNALRTEDEESEHIRVEAHTKIIMSIDKIWVWPREMAALKLKGDDNIAILPLLDPNKKAEIIDSEEGEAAQIAISPRLIQALSGDFEVPKARRH